VRIGTIAIAIVSTLALIVVAGCSHGPADTFGEHEAVPVLAAKVVQKTVADTIRAIGRVEAYSTVDIKAQINGQIMQVNVREGQNVKQGESLIVIDPRPFQVQLEQMQAQLFKDQATLRDAKLNLDRYTALIPSGSIAQQQVDTQKATVDQLDGQVRTDQAQVDNARLQITYCHITAPFNGRIGLRQVDPGNIVHASDTTPMLILTQLQPIAVIFTLPEDQLQTVSKHMRNSTLQVDAYARDNQTKLATGKLQTIDNQIDQTTGTAKLKAVFDNIDNQLWPNQFVNANLLLETRKNSTVLPTAAILRGPQGTFVYSLKPDKTVEARLIGISLTQGNITTITSGLNPGDLVVTDGQDKLQTGSKVEPRTNAPSSTPSGRNGKGSPASEAPSSGTPVS